MSDLQAPIFPDQILSEILTRLPSKTACQLKLISKHFNTLISTPHFIHTHISRHVPTFLKLEPLIYHPTDSPSDPTQLTLSPHSNIYTFSITPSLLSPSDKPSPDYPVPPSIIQTSCGLILFAFPVYRNPLKDGIEAYHRAPLTHRLHSRKGNRFNMVYTRDVLEDAYFITNPVTKQWCRLPRPPNIVVNRNKIGFVTRVGNDGLEFVVAAYEQTKITCYSSKNGRWVEKKAGYELRERVWKPYNSFEFEGKLVWGDVSVGIVTWQEDDPFSGGCNDKEAKCVFTPLPSGRRTEECNEEMMKLRWIGTAGGGGAIQFMELVVRPDSALEVWRLVKKAKSVSLEWKMLYRVKKETVEGCLGFGLFSLPTVSYVDPVDEDVVILCTGELQFELNVRTQKVESCNSFVGHTSVMSFVVPSWPVPLPPRLYADYAKEQGNEHFQLSEFDEAISCFSRCISLLPCAAAYANRAMTYLKVSKFQEAEDDCSEALNLDDKYFKVYVRRAIARKELGKFEGAMGDVNFALTLQPDDAETKKLYDEIKCLIDKESGGEC